MHTMGLIHHTPNIFVPDTGANNNGAGANKNNAGANNNGAGGFARYFSALIDGKLHTHKPDPQADATPGREFDLLVVDSPRISLREQIAMTFKPKTRPPLPHPDNQSTSVLYLRQPHWPIKSILLVIRGRLEDEIAIGWMLRIAHASQARVTILGIIPDIPALYSRYGFIPTRFEDLVEVDSISGYQLRSILKLMAKYGIEGHFHLVQSSPNQQILEIATAVTSDLIIIAAESRGKLMRKWLGELVQPLLKQAEWPVLVASPIPGRG